VELEGLPHDADPKQIRQMYFSNEHVVKTEQQVNSITGKSNGYAKVKLRCQNGLRSDALLKTLYKKGVKFRVNTVVKATDISNKNPVYRNQAAAGLENRHKNFWLGMKDSLHDKQK
jgi:hypothetical protein